MLPVCYEHVVESRQHSDLSCEIPLKDIANTHLTTMSKNDLDQKWKLDEFF